jgi:multisubunit Na+/H+ antiporter MnhB subunit
MTQGQKFFAIFIGIMAALAVGLIEKSPGLGFIAGVSAFNMFILMAITGENL